MEIITYSLRNGRAHSDQYYRDVADFTDELLAHARKPLASLVEAFQDYLLQTGAEAPRSKAEYVFELLTLGCLWKVYADQIPDIKGTAKRFFSCLAGLRQRGGILKGGADFLRGFLSALILSPNRRHPTKKTKKNMRRFGRLLNWLKATNDFKEETKRLSAWYRFLTEKPPKAATEALEKVLKFTVWFEKHSQTVLGKYSTNVERFLSRQHPAYRWREDYIFCGRQRLEYHLNMVGTEILNRAFRESFLAQRNKIVILPPCMRARSDQECKARETGLGQQCAKCTPGCQVNQLTSLGEKYGFRVLIMPDELSVFSGKGNRARNVKGMGVVGVSCVLTNPPGGWETKDLGVPSQGILLDYCGCRYHWHKTGIPTQINANQLVKVLGIKRKGSA